MDGDLGALAGLAGDRLDLDGALIDLGHLLLKQTTHELGVGTGDDNRRTAVLATDRLQVGVGVANVDNHGLDVLVVQVDLAGGAVDGHLGAPLKMQDLGIALGERLLQAVDQVELVDVLLLAKLHQGGHHVGCCHLTFLPSRA